MISGIYLRANDKPLQYNEPMSNAGKCMVLLIFLTICLLRADVTGCHCDLKNAAEMSERACSLCAVAEREPSYLTVFFLKDANPTKPDRLLALPRAHGAGEHLLSSLNPETRLELWSAAIARAQELWGDQWAIACNSVKRRSQCHTHLHIGKLLPNEEEANFTVVSGPTEIPTPGEGGIWIHPVAGKLHVHLGDDAPEAKLMR